MTETDPLPLHLPLPEEIDVQEAAQLLETPEAARWIDCREIDEWHICRIEGAELVPLSNFAEEAKGKLKDPSQRLIIYCHHGVRSLRATRWLRGQGYAKVQSLAGGIDRWTDLIDPNLQRY
jgi:rhodanese-related sulfurtransferase